MSESDKPEATPTLHGRLTKLMKNSWVLVAASLAATAVIYASNVVDAVTSIIKAVSPERAKVTIVVTAEDSGDCNYQLTADELMRQKTILDVGINNGSDRSILLTSVTIMPDWVTGSFFAGETVPSKQYDVMLSDWLTMVQTTRHQRFLETLSDDDRKDLKIDAAAQARTFDDWCRPKFGASCSRGTRGLIEAGRIKNGGDASEEWWVKPDPVAITAIPGNKYAVGKGTVERFRIRLGLERSIDFLHGSVFLEVRTDSGEVLKSGPLEISICNPGK